MPKSARVYGPYKEGRYYRLKVCHGKVTKNLTVSSLEEGERVKAELEQSVAEQRARTVGEVLPEYVEELRAREITTATHLARAIERFLGTDTLLPMTPSQAAAIYEAETKRVLPSKGRTVAAAAHQSTLKRCQRFYDWAKERGYVPNNPFASIKPFGRVNVGKAQLRIDEARRFAAHAMQKAEAGDPGSCAAMVALFLGLRASEVLNRQVRDLDDNGRILWIPKGKTKNARRRLQVPEELQPLLLKRTRDKAADAYLISQDGHRYTSTWLWIQVRKLCEEAGVPLVCPHSLRGLHSTLALEAGITANAVASALGHGSFAITARHYAAPGAVDSANSRKVVASLVPSTTPAPPLLSSEIEQSLSTLGLSEEQATSLRALFLKQRMQSGSGSGTAN